MKKKIISSLIICSLLLLFFTACGGGQTPQPQETTIKETFTTENHDFIYSIDSLHSPFGVALSDEGFLYYIRDEFNGNELVRELIKKDLEGFVIKYFTFENLDMITAAAVYDGVYYFASTEFMTPDTTDIYSLNLTSSELKKLVSFESFFDAEKIVPASGRLYILGKDRTVLGASGFYGSFVPEGKIVRSVDLSSYGFEDVAIDYPISLAATDNGSIMIYAFEPNDGLLFKEYDVGSSTFISSHENLAASGIDNFEMYGDSAIVYSAAGTVNVWHFGAEGAARIVNDFLTQPFISGSGYLFYGTREGIRRILIETFLDTSGVILNVGFTEMYFNTDYLADQNNPEIDTMLHPVPSFPNLGFQINHQPVEYYDFALEILSGSRDFDMYYINSRHPLAHNIRRQGAFYPFNDVPFVGEYLDAVFPYVKDAALDQNGDIWMIPILLNEVVLSYSDVLWEKQGLDFDSIATLKDLIEVTKEIKYMYEIRYPNRQGSYDIYFQRYFYQLMKKHDGFDREAFREMAEYFYNDVNYIKEDLNYSYGGWHFSGEIFSGDDTISDVFINISILNAFSPNSYWYAGDIDDEDEDIWRINYQHGLIPMVEGLYDNDVTVEFIAVNPNSENLEAVLEFISQFAQHQLNLRNSFILQDPSTYSLEIEFVSDVYNIFNYEHNYILFNLSNDIIWSDFHAFLGDEITLDEYLNRVEFKINAFLNE